MKDTKHYRHRPVYDRMRRADKRSARSATERFESAQLIGPFLDPWGFEDYDEYDCIDCTYDEDEPDDLLMVGKLVLSTPTLADAVACRAASLPSWLASAVSASRA